MKLSNALKKLSKYGKTEIKGIHYQTIQGDTVVEFLVSSYSEEITCIRVRSIHDKDDSQSDYSAGVWVDNLSQAIKVARFVPA